MGVQASANAFVCFKDLIGDTTFRTKGVDHEGGVEASDSSAEDPDGEFLTRFRSFRGHFSVKNSHIIDIRWRLVRVFEPRVDSSRYINTGELGGAQSICGKEAKRPSDAGFSQRPVGPLFVLFL
jgi:hypothetical protein